MTNEKSMWTLTKILHNFTSEWKEFDPKLSGNMLSFNQGVQLKIHFLLGKYAPKDRVYVIGHFTVGKDTELLFGPNDLATVHRAPQRKLFGDSTSKQYSLEIGKNDSWEASLLQKDAQGYLKEFVAAMSNVTEAIRYTTETLPNKITAAGKGVEKALGTSVSAVYLTGLKIALEFGSREQLDQVKRVVYLQSKKHPREYSESIAHLQKVGYLPNGVLD